MAGQVNLWNVAVTRAKSQLITVGGHAFWQGQSGLPTLLAGRSVPLGADAGEHDKPVVTAASAAGFRQELADRLQQYLAWHGITDLEWLAVIDGHPVDLLFTAAGENTAVLIDSGPPPGGDPARHLRLTHARGDLLTGLPSGGSGAKACPVGRTVRVPAWRILAGEEALAPLFG
ncbi:hypothetical protein ACWCQB_22450 [Streptomyces hirsutus]